LTANKRFQPMAANATIGERLHAIIKASARALSPRLWCGMPAYAKDGTVVCPGLSGQRVTGLRATS
jgi:hypothetical protein